ncbi:MAG: ferrous iron transport protein B [Flavobacteriales bacterium]|nr:ferrous iron transport protein B [Flavobacteriales bacterium]MCB9174690.1 ferrous iron transport protein B [Flavobacteriales bacterium]
MAEKNLLNVLLVGNPNTGKSTLFNGLTGLSQKVGNFPGVTVDKKSGTFKVNNQLVNVVDLPGTYSLSPNSEDEKVTHEQVLNAAEHDVIVVVADVTNLKRNMLLLTQIMDLGKKVVLVLNMMDLLQKNKQEINIEKLASLLGISVIPINAQIGKGLQELKEAVINCNTSSVKFIDEKTSSSGVVDETMLRYSKINQILSQCLNQKGEDKIAILTKKIDNILTHKIYGYLIFLGILFTIFQAIFSWSSYPMELIENGFLLLGEWLGNTLPPGIFNDLMVNGIVAGLSGIFVFVPQITMLFGFIVILEDTGYMSRVSFLMDRILRQFGLNGKSIIPLLSSTACAVPAIMSTRTINNFKERLITIMVAPLISCSARIPVYTLLISLVIPKESSWGIFNMQGLLMMGLYLIGFIAALAAAWVMKKLIQSKEKSSFIMEMPIYRMPRWKNVGLSIYSKVQIFLFDAGKIIVAISIVLWVLSSYGPGDKFEQIEKKYTVETYDYTSQSDNKMYNNTSLTENEINTLIAAEKLESSYAGMIGKTIEPLIQPIGFDWKIGISLVTSFAAREVFVGTMATLYSVGDEDNTASIRTKMMNAKNHVTGEKLYSKATTMSLLLFYAFAMQCMATLAVVYRETKSIKWPLIQLVYMGVLAYLSSFIVYQIFA